MSAGLRLFAHRDLDSPLLLAATGVVSVGVFLAQAEAIAREIPAGRPVVNLCNRRSNFLAAGVGALLAGATMLLPPNRLPGAIARLVAEQPDCTCLVDGDDAGAEDSWLRVDRDDGLRPARSFPLLRGDVAVVFFSSGTTGVATRHARSLDSLAISSRMLAAHLALKPDSIATLGTVASQHMFGFETQFMLPLAAGVAVIDATPFYPEDLDGALRMAGTRPVWMFSTPHHLRALHGAGIRPTRLRRVVCATMPLSPGLAAAVESDWDLEVHDVYGSTETGAIALRRPSVVARWTALPGVRLYSGGDGMATVGGPHLPQDVRLSDVVEGDASAFSLSGRAQDLVKIGGKRASLEELNALLAGIEGIAEGCFLPRQHGGLERLELVAAPHRKGAAPAAGRRVSLACVRRALAAQVDPVLLPRKLHWVETLPRDRNGKIRVQALRELLDSLDDEGARG